MEKHWKSVINRSICDYFFEEQKKVSSYDHISPVIATPKHVLINIFRCKLYLVAVLSSEYPPLFVIEFLHKIVDVIIDYFQECNESIIKDNYVVVYELLDEMLDNGFPLITEPNILKELIKPPNFLRTITNTVTGKSNISADLHKGQLTNVPWRKMGIKYTNNEAYFDIIEEIDAIIDKYGSVITSEIQGNIDCSIKLSGMPELTMCFTNPRILDDASFHPCVKLKYWESDKKINFIPPDGNFRLMSYKVSQNISNNSLPLMVQHTFTYSSTSLKKSANTFGINSNAKPDMPADSISYSSGKFEIIIAPKNTGGKTIETCSLVASMPKSVLNLNLNPTQGVYTYDPVSKIFEWNVGRIELFKGAPQIKGTMTLQPGSIVPEFNPTISLHFTIPQLAISGIRVSRLDLSEKLDRYKPFKGVKYITKAGKFQIRT